tara:strand:+ start:730 stop:1734 length:1005 start_codon:yes stop_codon:yes gene_type:complete
MPRKAKPKAEKPAPKKRGRKPKKKVEKETPTIPKKRGRKPKGGKILKKNEKIDKTEKETKPNIVLHLKCKTSSLNELSNFNNSTLYNPEISDPSDSLNIFNNSKLTSLNYKILETNNDIGNKITTINHITKSKVEETQKENINMKEVWGKLNKLKENLRCNNVSDKNSACFWCTYDFDSPAIYIPKQINNGLLEVYGCFCSPECSCAYLKNQDIDNSIKWERYALLNNTYCKIFDYSRNIKPAPNPHYTLEKYYGNLSIQEYRKLLNNERILMVVDKPMTKVLPELYEENNEIPNIFQDILHNSNNKTSTKQYRLQRSQEKKTKTNALVNNFNL